MVDLNKFLELPKVKEAWEVVGEWKFVIENCPVTLKIKVLKSPNGSYKGVANYKIQGPGQADPYLSSQRLVNTVEDAIRDSLWGFLDFWDPDKADQIKLVPTESY